MSGSILRYRAGAEARQALERRGLAASLGALAGPASGPRWLCLAGLDEALAASALLAVEGGERTLAIGASAGAWRMAALASPDPVATHRRLLAGYVEQGFTRRDSPVAITEAYRELLERVFRAEDTAFLLDHPRLDLALHTVRSRRALALLPEAPRALAMVKASVLVGLSGRAAELLAERILFCSAPHRFRGRFRGTVVGLTPESFHEAALATACMPIYFRPRWNLPGAPAGPCYDGGVLDYQLREPGLAAPGRIVLMPHYQERLERAWWSLPGLSRRPSRGLLENLLLIHPSGEFLASLPGGRLPDVSDFKRFVDAPHERTARWYEVAARSRDLGERFLSDLESGALSELVEPL